MTVWIVGVEDRESPIELHVKDTYVEAVALAERRLLDLGGPSRHDEDIHLLDGSPWTWYHSYGTAGECVWIRQARVQST